MVYHSVNSFIKHVKVTETDDTPIGFFFKKRWLIVFGVSLKLWQCAF